MTVAAADLARLGPTAERVYQTLLTDIEDGTLAVNSRLPSERVLCERFEVNRGTLRRALMRLGRDGYLETRRGSGSHICAVETESRTTNVISVMCGDSLPDLSRLTMLALRNGCTLGIYAQNAAKYDSEMECLFLGRVMQQRHRALLASCTPQEPHHDALLGELVASGTRLLHTEPYRLDLPDQCYLMPDYQRAGRAAATTLILDGFRRIVALGMPLDGPIYQLVRRGAEEVLVDHGLAQSPTTHLDDDPVYGTRFHMEPGHFPSATARWDRLAALITEPTGLVVPGLVRAAEARAALRQRGVCHRVRVVGIEVTRTDERHYVTGDTYTFNRAAIYERAIELVTGSCFGDIRELVPAQLWRTS